MTTDCDILMELSLTNTEIKNSFEKHKNSAKMRIYDS